MTNPRRQLVDKLIRAGLIGGYKDFSIGASALERGESKKEGFYTPQPWKGGPRRYLPAGKALIPKS